MKLKNKQQGFSLFMVMILMLVIALLVMVSVQSANTESRMSANEADRKFALELAEEGLDAGETLIRSFETATSVPFTAACDNGYCTPSGSAQSYQQFTVSGTPTVPAWERCVSNPANLCQIGSTVLDNDCSAKKKCLTTNNSKVRYIMEYLGSRIDTSNQVASHYFRVTSRARGNNADTVVTLQSHVELSLPRN